MVGKYGEKSAIVYISRSIYIYIYLYSIVERRTETCRRRSKFPYIIIAGHRNDDDDDDEESSNALCVPLNIIFVYAPSTNKNGTVQTTPASVGRLHERRYYYYYRYYNITTTTFFFPGLCICVCQTNSE